MCSIPAWWCRLLLAEYMDGAAAPKPILMYLGLPLLQDVAREDRFGWFADFVALSLAPENIVLANNPYLAEEVAWQTGVRVPVQRTPRPHGRTRTEILEMRMDVSSACRE